MEKNKLFVILPRFPYPLDKGDKLRAYHQIKHLSKDNDITLFAITHESIDAKDIQKLEPFCSHIYVSKTNKLRSLLRVLKAFFTGEPFQVAYFYNNKIRKEVEHIVSSIEYDNVYCQLIRTAEYVRGIDIIKTIDFQDAFSKNALRRANGAKNWIERMFFRIEAKRVLKYEQLMCKEFDYKTIITEEDRSLVGNEMDITVVRNGVDIDFFSPQLDVLKKYDVVFTGNMGYHPNVDAGLFLANEIIDLVRKVRPNGTLLIAGASPTAALRSCESEYTHVSGWMDDIRDAYAESKVFVAPLRMGSGLQNKLLEAMAMGLPCVTSELANQALAAKENEEILIANTAQEFADKIIKLLEDEVYSSKIASKGREFVMNNYSWESETNILNSLFQNKA